MNFILTAMFYMLIAGLVVAIFRFYLIHLWMIAKELWRIYTKLVSGFFAMLKWFQNIRSSSKQTHQA